MKLDLNSDIGEGFAYDAEIIKLVDSVNIACGGHAGNIALMNETVQLAKQAGIHIGAHPGYPDKEHFGRVDMDMSPDEIYDEVSRQIKTLKQICDKHNAKLHHVKPHGQLYNKAAKDKATAQAITSAIKDIDKNLIIVVLANSQFVDVVKSENMQVWQEFFVDRNYQASGELVPRSNPNAVIHNEEVAINRLIQLAETGEIPSVDGQTIQIAADTVCVHGDTPEALQYVKKIREKLGKYNVVTTI